MASTSTLKTYYDLTKPGIIRGNLITAAAGFLWASQGSVSLWKFVAMAAGLALIIAAGCVCNNVMDRGIDQKMARTRQRALVVGSITSRSALVYAAGLGIVGLVILLSRTNILTASLAGFGFVAYVGLYGYAKRRSVHGTVIGSISGAIPPVVGYCAVSGRLDLTALILFLILVFWQMPHFYAIAMYRLTDYTAAGIPVLPAQSGHQATKQQIVVYILAFIVTAAALATRSNSHHYIYLVAALGSGLAWLGLGLRGLRTADEASDIGWARKMFGLSLLVITLLCAGMAVDSFVHI